MQNHFFHSGLLRAPMNIITDTDSLAQACLKLGAAEYVTVDTEFQRTNTFWPILCLVQLAGPNDEFIVDPLADNISMKPFYDLMADKSVLKVLHASRQDLEIFCHEASMLPQPVFDTQLAAMVCGFGDSVGYETLVNQLAGTSIDKSSRFTDWTRRPLSKKQLNYAIGDVSHLRVVYESLAEMLVQNGREEWLREEMDDLTSMSTYITEPEDAWLRLKTKSQNRRFLAVVRAVAAWREERAQKIDIPRNRVLRDDVIMEIAAHPPKNTDDLKRVRSMPDNIVKNANLSSELISAITNAVTIPDDQLPQARAARRLPKGLGPTIELLKVLLKQKCDESGVAQKLVANTADLEELAANDGADIRSLKGWRFELYGRDALSLKAGRLALSIKEGRVILTKVSSEPQFE